MLKAVEAEREVLASIMLSPELDIYLDTLTQDDFNESRNAELLKVMQDIRKSGKHPDIITVNAIKPDMLQYVLEITGDAFVAGFQEHLQLIKDVAAMRKMYLQAQKVANMAKKESDANEVLAYALNTFNSLLPKKAQSESFNEVVEETINEIEDRYRNKDKHEYYMNSLNSFNAITAGLHKAELHIIAARPSVGKTAFGLQLTEDIAKNGIKTLFFSREMSKTQLVERMLAKDSGVSHWNIRTGRLTDDDWRKLGVLGLKIGELPIIIDTSSANIEDIKLKSMSISDVGLIVVDYIQLVGTKQKYDSRKLELGAISRELKNISMELNIPVVALAQINRDAANRVPGLENLAESGNLEQDADNVYFLYRPNEQPLWNSKRLIEIEFIAAKQRQAPIGKKDLIFNPDRQRFYDIDNREE
jgi:replicative DNA helicase